MENDLILISLYFLVIDSKHNKKIRKKRIIKEMREHLLCTYFQNDSYRKYQKRLKLKKL